MKYFFLAVILLFVVIYFIGPKPPSPDFSKLTVPSYSSQLQQLEDSVKRAEASFPLKPDNEARIVWARPYEKTPYSIVYLHGNAASQEEGDPIHEALVTDMGVIFFFAG